MTCGCQSWFTAFLGFLGKGGFGWGACTADPWIGMKSCGVELGLRNRRRAQALNALGQRGL